MTTRDRTSNGDPAAPGTIQSGRLAGKSLGAAICILALPVLLQQAMQACVGLVDKVISGSLPEGVVVPALDGLGIGSYVGWFIGIALTGLGIGAQAVIARAMGAGQRPEAERALGQTIFLSMVWGGIVGAALWLVAPWMAAACGLDEQAFGYCVQYVRCVACSMPFQGLMLVGSMCLYGAGETARPSAISIVVNVINIILSWILSGADLHWGDHVLVNPFTFDLHVLGIALGTAISYGLGAAMTVAVLARGVKDLRLRPAEMPLDPAMVSRVVRIGIPNFFEGISMWAVNLAVLLVIGVIARETTGGQGLQGAHIIAVQWESFSFLPGFAIGTAAGALAGQYLGAGNPKMAARAIIACVLIAIPVMGGIGLVFIFNGGLLTRIVSSEPIHTAHVPRLLLIAGVTQVFFAITMVIRQGLRGVGDTRWTFMITTISSYGVRLPGAWFFGVHLGWGLEGVWVGLCGELIIRAALFYARFRHGGWTRVVV